MFSKHLSKTLTNTIYEISSKVPLEEIETEAGRKKLDAIIDSQSSPFYFAIVNPVKLKINYFCKGGLDFLGLPNFDYKAANFGLLTKILAKENMSMVYQGIQHFMSNNRDSPLELTFKVKRHDGVWRNIFFITKILDYKNEAEGLNTISILIDIEDYLSKEFQKKVSQNKPFVILNEEELNKLKTLSVRELELLVALCSDQSIKDIADKFFISVHTVRAHKRSIQTKLDSKSPFVLAKYAVFIQYNSDLFN